MIKPITAFPGNDLRAYQCFVKTSLRTLVATAVLLALFSCAWCQGFVDLDFESVNVPLPQEGPFVPTSDALPGWAAYLFQFTIQSSSVFYNSVPLDGPGISLVGPGAPGLGSFILQGHYSVELFGSHGASPTGPAGIGQTGQVPADAKSLQFLTKAGTAGAKPTLQVTFEGQNIPIIEISHTAGYYVMGGDISAFSGQAGQLLFIAPPNQFGVLDDIQFSPQIIPEPSSLVLAIMGTVVLGCLVFPKRLNRKTDYE